jgi:uncharacterized protein YbbK (DUF523 family)
MKAPFSPYLTSIAPGLKRLCALLGAQGAVLKARSPSCGKGQVYDGSFSGTLTAGDGITAGLLRARGIPVWTEEEGAQFAAPSP